MPTLKPRDPKQEARPGDEIDSEESSEGNERLRFANASSRFAEFSGQMPRWRKPLSVRLFRGFSFATRGAAVKVLSRLLVAGFRSVSLVPQSSIPEFNVSFGSAAPLLQILGILRNDVHVHRRRFPQEPMHCRQVKVFAPVPDRRTPENYLRNVF